MTRLQILGRALAGAIIAVLITSFFEAPIVDAYSSLGLRWCDRWADVRPAPTYTLEQYPVSNAAFYWSQVEGFAYASKVNFDYYFYGSSGAARVELYSDNYPGLNGTVADASWVWFGECFSDTSILFNTSYWFYPPTTACQQPYGYYNLETVALHELGHTAGLWHSAATSAVMYQTLPACTYKGLDADDRYGILNIYGERPR